MYFYKYQKASLLSINMLRHGELYFASQKELNDSHECRPQFIFSGDSEIWSRFIHKIIVTICINLDLKPDSDLAKSLLSFEKNILTSILNGRKTRSLDYEALLQKIDETFSNVMISNLSISEFRAASIALNHYLNKELDDELNENLYMSSFSKSANNLTMWGHYGDAEKGFALVYECLNGDVKIESDAPLFYSFETEPGGFTRLENSTSTRTKIMSVDYKNKPVRVNAFSRLINNFIYSGQELDYDYSQDLLSRINHFNEQDVGWVKYSDWKYEKELRLHLPVYGALPAPLRNIRISAQHIKGVIFGSRTSPTDKENIISACYHLKKSHSGAGDIFIFEAKAIKNQYKINVKAVGTVPDHLGRHIPYITRLTKDAKTIKEEAIKIAEAINLS